jgi:hypothetical protein
MPVASTAGDMVSHGLSRRTDEVGQVVLHGSLGSNPKAPAARTPFGAFCLERGIVTAAEICDHVEPHHGDVNQFWLGPFQSLSVYRAR